MSRSRVNISKYKTRIWIMLLLVSICITSINSEGEDSDLNREDNSEDEVESSKIINENFEASATPPSKYHEDIDLESLRKPPQRELNYLTNSMPGRMAGEIYSSRGNRNRGGSSRHHNGGMPSGSVHDGMNGRRSHRGGNEYKNNYNTYSTMNNSHSTNPFKFFGPFYEIIMILFVGGFIFNCFIGKTQNDKYAMSWYSANKQYFQERYTVIGMGKDDLDTIPDPELQDLQILQDDLPITKESPFLFKFYAAKYRYVNWLLVILEFRKRTDTISLFASAFISTKDRIIYEVAINPVEEVAWMFCICNKKDIRTLRKTYPDIDYFTKQHDPSFFNEGLTVLTENEEVFVELFQNKHLFNFYKSIEPFIDIIYYTDMQTFCRDKHALFFSFEFHLNQGASYDRKLLEITHFVNLLADTLAQVKYKENVKKDFENNRVMFERSKLEEAMRQEIEEKEKRDFIEQWKMKNKMKGKKQGKKKDKVDNKRK